MSLRAGALAVLVVLCGCGGFAGSPDAVAGDGATMTPAPVPNTTDVSTGGADPPRPPGVGPDGIENVIRLARAHRTALENRSYVWVEVENTIRRGGPGDYEWERRAEQMRVEHPTRYRRNLTRIRGRSGSGFEWYNRSTFANGSVRFERVSTGGSVRARNTVSYEVGPARDERDQFAYAAAFAIRQFLSSGNASVTLVRREGALRYRIVTNELGFGRYNDYWRNYSAVAYVAPSGLVHHFSVRYDVDHGNSTEWVNYEFHYRRLGGETVSAPGWLEAARANATVGGGSDPDPAPAESGGPGTNTSIEGTRTTSRNVTDGSRDVPGR